MRTDCRSPGGRVTVTLANEFFGIVTNLAGGWLASAVGLRVTLLGGLLLQVTALALLALMSPAWPATATVAYVMAL